MTHATAVEELVTTAPVPQVGPVLLAMKPGSTSPAALAVARWLAMREERGLRVVAVLQQEDPLAVAAGMTPMGEAYYEAERVSYAEELGRTLAESDPFSEARIEVLDGACARSIVEAADRCCARLIVIGAGAHAMPERYIFGESALKILDLADRPVLIVPAGAHAGPVSVAVVAVDFSAASVRAARAVFPMLSERSRLRLVHVRSEGSPGGAAGGRPDRDDDARIAEQFKEFQRQLPWRAGVTVDLTTLRGDPSAVLARFALECEAGLIACGRLTHSFLQRLFVTSVSSDLVRRVACPVLVVPESPGDPRIN